MNKFLSFVFVLLFLPPVALAKSHTVNIAVAANFSQPIQKLADTFHAQTGIDAVITVASSGTLFAQIVNGAPFDIFLSADANRPEKLVEANKALASQVKAYAQGRLAMVTRAEKMPDINGIKTYVLAPNRRLAMANPRLAPYGLAAKEFLQHLALWPQVQASLVTGNNVMQAYQYYSSGNVDAALVALSLVKDTQATVWIVPTTYHAPIVQKYAIIKEAKNSENAQAFADFLRSRTVQAQLANWGYSAVLD